VNRPIGRLRAVWTDRTELLGTRLGERARGSPVGMLAGRAIVFSRIIGFDSIYKHAEEARILHGRAYWDPDVVVLAHSVHPVGACSPEWCLQRQYRRSRVRRLQASRAPCTIVVSSEPSGHHIGPPRDDVEPAEDFLAMPRRLAAPDSLRDTRALPTPWKATSDRGFRRHHGAISPLRILANW